MSDPDRAEFRQSSPDLSSQWSIAIVTSAAVGFAMGTISSVIRDGLDLTSPDAGFLATLFLFVLEIVAAVPSFAVYASRTGGVLQQKLPALPMLTWYALHVFAGVALGVIVAWMEVGTRSEPYRPPAPSLVSSVAIGGIIAGAVLGAVIGTLQAIVLRKAAVSVGLWIGWSMAGGTALGLFACTLYVDSLPNLWSQILTQALGFVVAVIAGLALLPAVHRIEPR